PVCHSDAPVFYLFGRDLPLPFQSSGIQEPVSRCCAWSAKRAQQPEKQAVRASRSMPARRIFSVLRATRGQEATHYFDICRAVACNCRKSSYNNGLSNFSSISYNESR